MLANIIAWVLTNYILLLSVYVVGGVIYAVIKWTLMLLKLRRLVNEIDEVAITKYRNKWSANRDKSEDDLRTGLRIDAACNLFGPKEYPPRAKNNKGNLMFWAAFWPLNAIYTMFADVAVEIWNAIYNAFSEALNAIARAILPN